MLPIESAETMDRVLAPKGPATGAAGLLAVGQAFGVRYHIIRLLGAGGMGAVYQAWDAELGVSVALKVVKPQATGDAARAQELERRFKRELLLARQVTHANVVRIHDLGEIDGIRYLTMSYVEGTDLSKLLAKGKLPLAQALSIAKQVAFGLRALGGDGRWRFFLASVAGIILVHVLMLVPYLGVLLVIAGLILGLGSVLLLLGDRWTSRGQRS